jgi:hypothetical protein
MAASQVKVTVKTETSAAFKAACAANGVSMASAMANFMESYGGLNAPKNGYSPNLSTKRQRRAAARKILTELARIRENEETYIGNIPANLQSSEAHEAAENCVALVEEAIEALEAAYMG